MSDQASFQAKVDRLYTQLLQWQREEKPVYPSTPENFCRALMGEIDVCFWPALAPVWADAVQLGLVTVAEFPGEPEDCWAALRLLAILRERCRGEGDDSDYMPANKCRNGRIQTHKQLKTLLDEESTIRRYHKGQHLRIHAGDWERWKARQEEQEWEALDRARPEADRAMAEMRSQKARKKSTGQ
jgi:hypothetical protein